MKRPTIGITSDYSDADPNKYELTMYYARSIELAGGLPVMLPFAVDLALVPQYVERCDGILLAGGCDIDPATYGEAWHPMAQHLDPRRQAFEMALLAEIDRRRKPVLGICLGSQMMNVHRGGSLFQFLPDADRADPIEHRRDKGWGNRHEILIKPQTSVAQALGKTEITGNSSHKQAVKDVGRGLRVIATAPDGIVEGIEDPSMPLFVGVQWHPERMSEQDDHLALFKMLVEKAAQHGSPNS
jgi:putative glutamine amidotransferase